jgi:site-specific recombinase XerD
VEQVDWHDVQRWASRLLDDYSTAYASNQVRAIRRFLKWLAAEEDRPDPVAGLRAPRYAPSLVPVFTSEELSALRRACGGRSFEARRGAAVLEVFLATGIRRAEMTAIRYSPGDLSGGDVSLADREIRVCGKAGKDRHVKIGTRPPAPWTGTCGPAARHPQAGARSCGW